MKTSSTDYDLTGQIIWKAADILSKYIIDELGEKVLKGSSVLEVGSGPGLCGLVAQQWASRVVLSDYQDLVMDLICINIKDSLPKWKDCQLLSAQLDWMKASEPTYYDSLPVKALSPDTSSLIPLYTFSEFKLDYIIGSDIVYWTSSIKPLMNVLTVSIYVSLTSLSFRLCSRETRTLLRHSTSATLRGQWALIPS